MCFVQPAHVVPYRPSSRSPTFRLAPRQSAPAKLTAFAGVQSGTLQLLARACFPHSPASGWRLAPDFVTALADYQAIVRPVGAGACDTRPDETGERKNLRKRDAEKKKEIPESDFQLGE